MVKPPTKPVLLWVAVFSDGNRRVNKEVHSYKVKWKEKGRVTFKSKMKAKGKKIVAGCLIGKVLNTRGVSIKGLKIAMQRVWKTSREVKI